MCCLYSHRQLCVYLLYVVSIKTLCSISSNPTFKETVFNLLLGIGIPELLLNLVSCHGFMTKSNSTVTLNFRSRLINNYLSKGFFIIEQGSKQLNLIPNYVISRINLVDQLKTDYVMVKNEALSSVANIINNCIFIKICIWYTNKTSIILKRVKLMICFLEYLAPVMKYIEHPTLIK